MNSIIESTIHLFCGVRRHAFVLIRTSLLILTRGHRNVVGGVCRKEQRTRKQVFLPYLILSTEIPRHIHELLFN